MPARNTPTKFWLKVKIAGDDECWLWLHGTTPDGYGYVKYCGPSWLAHRLAYTLAKGPIPSGMLVRHTCDNPPCCNPAHLLLGTDQDNCNDKWNRGRAIVVNGVSQWKSKLEDSQIVEIREQYASGSSLREIASRFPVSVENIRFIVNRRTWKHVC